jgi:superfamily II DNA or RNA helicase
MIDTIIQYITSNNYNDYYIQILLNKLPNNKLKFLCNNVKKKISDGFTKEQILICYDLYAPIVDIIIDNLTDIFKYRYGQDIAHNYFNNILNNKSYWGLNICPTGTGKGILHNLFICSYWNKYSDNIMLTTKRKDILIDQLSTLKHKFNILKFSGILKKDFNILNQVNSLNVNEINSCENSLIIINIDKLLNNYKNIDWKKIGFLIIDEVHWLSGQETCNMVKYIKQYVNFCIGSSATPIRANRESLENLKQIYSDPLNILFEMSYMDAWNNNIIVPIYHKYFIINKGLYDVKQSDDKIKYYFKKEAKDIISTNILKYLNVSVYKKCIGFCRDKKSLVIWYKYFKSLDSYKNYNIFVSFTKSKKICKYINDNNVDITHFDQITNFKNSLNNSILLVVFRANEGFDDQKVEIVTDLDFVECKSPSFLLQKIGRAQRICNDKKCGYYLSPIICNNKIDTLNYISNLMYDYIASVTQLFSKSNNDIHKKQNIDDTFELLSKFINIENFFDVSHEDILNNINLLIHSNGFTCKHAMAIIKSHINKGNILENKEQYYKLCEQYNRLPMDPEIVFKNFPGWITYFYINRNDYYNDPLQVINSVNVIVSKNKYISTYPLEIYNYCRTIDNKLPPMPVEFYKNDNIIDISYFVKSTVSVSGIKKRIVI